MLPGDRKGPEIADKLRQRHPDLEVLYMSGYQQGILTSEETQSSSVSFIQKPFTKNEFVTKISVLLRNAARDAL
jgi:two-component system cell cycle sensor histidine kinase/response regulator CckA